jgi:GNAT superfamily N-acetyltransferase
VTSLQDLRLAQPAGDEQWRQARALVEAYADALAIDLSFQDFAHELEHLAVEYGPPGGAFLLAQSMGAPLGCVGVRRFAADTAEMKRLYVAPAGRGFGLGRRLAHAAIGAARAMGYTRLVLDTLPSMNEARALYRSLGFTEITAYRFNPVAGTAFLELRLD